MVKKFGSNKENGVLFIWTKKSYANGFYILEVRVLDVTWVEGWGKIVFRMVTFFDQGPNGYRYWLLFRMRNDFLANKWESIFKERKNETRKKNRLSSYLFLEFSKGQLV